MHAAAQRQLAFEELSANPEEPAEQTVLCTAPSVVKGAAFSLGGKCWLAEHGGNTPQLPVALQRKVRHC